MDNNRTAQDSEPTNQNEGFRPDYYTTPSLLQNPDACQLRTITRSVENHDIEEVILNLPLETSINDPSHICTYIHRTGASSKPLFNKDIKVNQDFFEVSVTHGDGDGLPYTSRTPRTDSLREPIERNYKDYREYKEIHGAGSRSSESYRHQRERDRRKSQSRHIFECHRCHRQFCRGRSRSRSPRSRSREMREYDRRRRESSVRSEGRRRSRSRSPNQRGSSPYDPFQ